jgi:transcriptional regulator with XRE-family HTH domain
MTTIVAGMAKQEDVLDGVGERLRELRKRRDVTLAALAERTGISVSTLSRLESGGRKPTLELLLPLAQTYQVSLDELVGAPSTADPRVHGTPVTRAGMTMVPLTNRPGGLRAYKLIIRGTGDRTPRIHEGWEWLYVLEGQLRVVLGEHDLVLGPGEAAEFDTRTPHWFGCAERRTVEVLSLFGPQGERMHLRARPKRSS